MNLVRTLLLTLVVLSAAATAAPPPIVCIPQPFACKPGELDRLDPSLQRQLVEQQLKSQPAYWTTVYFYMPPLDDSALEELQIRYLEELLARHKAKAEATAGAKQPVAED
jgi:hypothetical protein